MATDMGGFAQAGGPVIVDRFGRPFQVNTWRDDFVAGGGETLFITSSLAFPASMMIWKNGSLLPQTAYSVIGKNIALATALTTGDILTISYSTTAAYPAATRSYLNKGLATSLYSKLLYWYELDVSNYQSGTSDNRNLKTGSTTVDTAGVRLTQTQATVLSANGGVLFNTSIQYCRMNVTALRGVATIAFRCGLKYGPDNTINRVIACHGLNPDPLSASGNAANNIGFEYYIDTSGVPTVAWQYGTNTWATPVADSSSLGTPGTIYWLGFDRDDSAKTLTHVRNGARATAQSYSTSPTGGTGSSTYPFLGGIPSSGFSGTNQVDSMQRVIFFNAPLTAAEDSYLYAGGAYITFGQLVADMNS